MVIVLFLECQPDYARAYSFFRSRYSRSICCVSFVAHTTKANSAAPAASTPPTKLRAATKIIVVIAGASHPSPQHKTFLIAVQQGAALSNIASGGELVG
jgi:hypothetical protein